MTERETPQQDRAAPQTEALESFITDWLGPETAEEDAAWRQRLAPVLREAAVAGLDVDTLARAIHMSHAATMEEVCGYPDRPKAIAILRELARLGSSWTGDGMTQDRAAPQTEAPNEQHVMPDWQEHKTASDCWCQPIYEDVPPNGRLWIHRAAHDEPHRRND